MKLRTRLNSSSPVKSNNLKKYEESSDWSLTSPISPRSTRSTRSDTTISTTSTSPTRSPSFINSSPSTRRSSNIIPEIKDSSDFESDFDEKEPIFAKRARPLLIEDDDENESSSRNNSFRSSFTENDMIDIMSNEPDQDENLISSAEIIDPTLQGLLEDDEINLDEMAIDDSDRKLYEVAFNRAEIPGPHNGAVGNNTSASSLIAKGPLRQNNSSVRGKGKDLFNVLKQRARGPTIPTIRKIYFGTDVAINPWYSAPYPSEYHSGSGELWICEFCLQYMKKPCQAQRHLLKCHGRLPPGDEIYRDSTAGISVFEINGRDAKLYCQNLCLLAKMFLDHKTLYYDVDPFLFYVLIEWKSLGTGRFLNSFVGYFSKEKINPAGFNVSCILTMPHHQRKGYGSFLIDFSYLLSRKEGRLGSPEKPLSDLGLFSYVSYWKSALLSYFSNLLPKDLIGSAKIEIPTIAKISSATGMTENDILSTLEYLRMLRFDIVADPKDPSKQGLVASILIDLAVIESFRAKIAARPQLVAREEFLRWHPYKCTK